MRGDDTEKTVSHFGRMIVSVWEASFSRPSSRSFVDAS